MVPGQIEIDAGIVANRFRHGRRQRLPYAGRQARCQFQRADDLIFQHHGARRHYRALFDVRPVQHHRVDADQALVLDRTSMNDRVVAHHDRLANDTGLPLIHMDGAVVLDIRIPADANRRQVAPDDRPVPDTGSVGDLDITNNNRRGGDKNVFTDLGGFPPVGQDHDPPFEDCDEVDGSPFLP